MQKFMFGMLLVAHFIYNPGSFYRTVIYKTSDKLITTLSLYKSNNYLHKFAKRKTIFRDGTRTCSPVRC